MIEQERRANIRVVDEPNDGPNEVCYLEGHCETPQAAERRITMLPLAIVGAVDFLSKPASCGTIAEF